MKITNTKHVKWVTYLLVSAALVPILGIILSNKTMWDLIFLGIIVIIFFLLLRMRKTEVEDSGGCLTVRQYHPFAKKGYTRPKLEFPMSSIGQYKIKEGLLTDHLDLKIHSQNSNKNMHVDLIFFERKQIRMLNAVLQKQIPV